MGHVASGQGPAGGQAWLSETRREQSGPSFLSLFKVLLKITCIYSVHHVLIGTVK